MAGLLTFFSPCVLPLIPAYLSYISGLSIKQLSGKEENEKLGFKDKLKILEAALMFIAGFGLIFILLGAAMANLVDDIFAYDWVNWVAGGIIIIFGLHFMGVIRIKFLNYEARADFTQAEQKGGFIGKLAHKFFPFLLGLSFALGWTPCIGPIFASIVSLAAQDGAGGKGLTLMIIYTVGLAIPFLLSALITSSALSFFNKVKQHFKVVEIIAGTLLILIGIAIATGGLGKISGMIIDMFQ
jgi:cytochrome c-type biogenesis protein